MTSVVVLAAAVALVGALLAFLVNPGDEQVGPPDPSAPDTSAPVDTDDPAAVLELMPTGPIDGKESWRLPVLVVPQSGLADRHAVTVLGRGFLPGDRVGVVMCASEAAVEGVAACSLGTTSMAYEYVTYANADMDGDVIAPMKVRQMIDTPFTGPIDCASAAERCLVAIGAVSDYDRSGGSFVDFAGAPPFVQPAMLAEPAGPYTAGQDVTVRAVGLLATRDVELVQCLGDACLLLARGQVAADGTFVGTGAVEPVLADEAGNALPCVTSCVLRIQGVGLRSSSSAPMPADLPITFAGEFIEPPPTTLPPDTTVSTTTPPAIETTTPAVETLPPMSTTTEVPTTTPPSSPPTDPLPTTTAATEGLAQLDVLAEGSTLVLTGTVESVDDLPLVEIAVDRMLKGAAGERVVIALEDDEVVLVEGDTVLVFLSRDEADVDSPYRLVRSDGLFTVTDGVISGGAAGPLLDALAGRTVDDVAELIGT